LSPDAVAPGTAGFSLTVNGSGFVAGAIVNWNGSPRVTTFVSKSQLTAAIPASDVAVPNTAAVTVVNPGPGGGASNVTFFEATLPTSAAGFGSSTLGSFQIPFGVATADFNRDGKLDLVVTSSGGNSASVLLGKGDGTFQPPVNYATDYQPAYVSVGDFNGDGKLDLVVANSGSNTVSILLGNGDGTFQPAINDTVTPGGVFPWDVEAGDFNEDGKLDLIVANNPCCSSTGSGELGVFLGNGNGTFQPGMSYFVTAVTVAVGDFNGDGHLDLAVAGDGVNVLLGNGDGTFQSALGNPLGSTYAVVAGDFNGDGILDLAVTTSHTISVLLGNGNGTFLPGATYYMDVAASGSGLRVADFNGDGKLDLAVSGFGTQVFLGNGDGTFQRVASFVPGYQSSSLAIGDFNGQGRLDLAVPTTGSSSVFEVVQSMLAPSSINVGFPLQLLQLNSTQQTVTLTNVSTQPVSITSITITGANAAEFAQNNNCASSIGPEATCTINIIFTPTQLGPRTASVTINSSAVGSPQLIALSGIGVVSGPNATLSSTILSLSCSLSDPPGNVCLCDSAPVTLSDFGNASLSITGIITAAPFSETDACDGDVAAGNACTIWLGFTPPTSGTFTGTLNINDNAPGSPQVVSLTGIASCH